MINVDKAIKSKKINGKLYTAKVYMDEAYKAFDCNWDSLCFGSNEDTIASVTVDNHTFFLGTSGEIEIVDSEGNVLFTNSNYKELEEAINSKDYNFYDKVDMRELTIVANNWFDIVLSENNSCYDSEFFLEEPKTIDELIECLFVFAESIINRE